MIEPKDCWMKDVCGKYLSGDHSCDSEVFCTKLFKLNELYNNSMLSSEQRKFIKIRLDSDGTDFKEFSCLKNLQNNIEDFVSSGGNLYLWSMRCGNGKTLWSIRLLQSYLNKIWYKSDLKCKALFIHVPTYLLALKNAITKQNDYVDYINENVLEADLVVWDEVAIKNLSNYDHEHLLSMINVRLDQGKSNIYTSNLSKEDLYEKVGERLYSRIVNLSTVIELRGSDKRGIK